MEGEPTITIKLEGQLKGFKGQDFHRVLFDVSLMKDSEPRPKHAKMIERVSDNLDIFYLEVPMPFPLANRDFVQRSLHLSNKDDPELVKQLELFDWEHTYYVLLRESIERPEYPPQSSPVRGEMKMNYWLVEQDPHDEDILKFRSVLCQNLNGNLPLVFVNKFAPKAYRGLVAGMIGNYEKNFRKK